MRTKPIQRDEVRVSYWHIMTLPIDSVRRDRERPSWNWGHYLEPIPKLWAPLLRSINQAKRQEWKDHRQRGWASADTPPEPIEAPHSIWSSSKYKCPRCRRVFYRVTYGGAACRYCSDKCADAARSAAMAKIRSAMVKARAEKRAAARAGRKCVTCGKPIKAQRSTMRFCSVRCRVAAHRNDNG